MKIQILGTGCPKCDKLTENARQAAENIHIDYGLEKITDINEIMSFGVMMTPALIVDGKLLFSGKVPSVSDLESIFKQ